MTSQPLSSSRLLCLFCLRTNELIPPSISIRSLWRFHITVEMIDGFPIELSRTEEIDFLILIEYYDMRSWDVMWILISFITKLRLASTNNIGSVNRWKNFHQKLLKLSHFSSQNVYFNAHWHDGMFKESLRIGKTWNKCIARRATIQFYSCLVAHEKIVIL